MLEWGRAVAEGVGVGWGEKTCRNTIGCESDGVCVCVFEGARVVLKKFELF